MKKIHRYKLLGLSLMSIVLVLLSGCNFILGNQSGNTQITLYFTDAEGTKMLSEARTVKAASEEDLLKITMEELLSGPSLPEHKRSIPENVRLLGITKEGTVAAVDLSGEYKSIPQVDELLGRYAIVRTVCGLSGVEKVKITVEGESLISSVDNQPIGALGTDDVLLDTQQFTDGKQIIRLYFPEKTASMVIPEARSMTMLENISEERAIVNELIKGPVSKELTASIPPETKVLSVETKDRICYVNFSQDFIDRYSGGTAGEMLTVQSIVASLTELDNVDRVQLLIEGKKVGAFIHMELSEPFERDYNYIHTAPQ